MSYINPELTAYKDGPNLDSFGRLRVSSVSTLFSYQPGPTDSPIYFDNYTSGSGTYLYSSQASILSTGGPNSGARSLRQTKVYWRYHPGKSLICRFAVRLNQAGSPTGNAIARKGYFDDNNGAFFGRDATGYFIGYRTNVSGSVVDTKIYQSDWNVDTCSSSGLNPSGVTVDFANITLMGIDFLAAGTGRIRYYIYLNGVAQIVHQVVLGMSTFNYLGTLNLPVRAEVFNDGGTGSNISIADYSSAVDIEDGTDSGEGSYTSSCGTKGTASASLLASATLTPILTIRLRDTFNGVTHRGHAHPTGMDILAQTNGIYWELRWNSTLTGASFTNVDATFSGVEFDISATAASGGTIIHSGYAEAGSKKFESLSQIGHFQSYIMARTYANVRDTITLMARGLAGAATAYAAISMEEQY